MKTFPKVGFSFLVCGATLISPMAWASTEDILRVEFQDARKSCVKVFQRHGERHAANQRAQTFTVAIGGVLTLLGGVAVNAAVKTVVMGFGISTATSGGQGVASGIANLLGNEAQTDQAAAENLRIAWGDHLREYQKFDAKNDDNGDKRRQILLTLGAACDGLYTPLSSAEKAAADKAAAENAAAEKAAAEKAAAEKAAAEKAAAEKAAAEKAAAEKAAAEKAAAEKAAAEKAAAEKAAAEKGCPAAVTC